MAVQCTARLGTLSLLASDCVFLVAPVISVIAPIEAISPRLPKLRVKYQHGRPLIDHAFQLIDGDARNLDLSSGSRPHRQQKGGQRQSRYNLMPLPHYSLFPFFHRYQTTYLRRDPLLFEKTLPQRTISCFFHEFIPVCRQLYFLDSNTAAPSQSLHLVSARVSAYDEFNRI